MGGDVWQWKEANFGDANRGIQGGSWYSVSDTLVSSGAQEVPPTIGLTYVGFRVASVAEPGSLLMLLMIALTTLPLFKRLHV